MIKKIKTFGLIVLCLLPLSGCKKPETEAAGAVCQVVLEKGEGFEASSYICRAEKGQDASFDILPEPGYEITMIDPPEGYLKQEGERFTLVLPKNRYTRTVRITASLKGNGIVYHANGGAFLAEDAEGEQVLRFSSARKLRGNTETGTDLVREGYTFTGWNTEPDGSGESVGPGSRIEYREGLELYAQWAEWSPAADFLFETVPDGVCITRYTGDTEEIVLPGELQGRPVRVIGEDSFRGGRMKTIILPDTIRSVEKGAFADSDLEEIRLFDNLTSFSDYAVEGATKLRTLHISAVCPPMYSGNYFGTFPDKMDRLLSLRDQKKIVLFSGSSTRFGYDSAALDAAFEGYEVVNMGVFAYTNAVPQMLLILDCMGEGDILLHSPEFDAAKRQFCTTSRMDAAFFAMCEGDYDLVSRLDLRRVEGTFSALTEYLGNRKGMQPSSYRVCPSDYDEDGRRVEESYNEYGDYSLYRENASDDAPIYGLPVEYTVKAFPKEAFLRPLNAMYENFLEKGIRVFFTYAPRNRLAISQASTPVERANLDAWLREELKVPVLGDVEESLVSGMYLYGTDNHLSTEGVQIRTERIIQELKEVIG